MTTEQIAIIGIGVPLALNALAWAFQAGGHLTKLRDLETRLDLCEKRTGRAQKGVRLNSNRITVIERHLGERMHHVNPEDSAIDLQVFEGDESDDGDGDD